jgi:4-aminobutyrate aminotransferase
MPDGALGHFTHEKSPVGAAAALETLAIIEDEDLLDRSRRLGAAALAELVAALGARPDIAAIRGLGLSLAIEIGAPDAEARAERILYRCLAEGLSFKIGAGTVLVLCPPLTIAEADLDCALAILLRAIAAEA